jgi:hypothetical protein
MPPENLKIYNVRVKPSRWEKAKAIADVKGDRISDVLRRHLDDYIAENEHVLPTPATRKEPAMTTTTQLHGFGTYTMKASVRDSVLDFVNEFADDFDLDGLTAAYRDAINAELDSTGIVLRGDDFYAKYPAPDDATELIKEAIEAADLGALAEQYDRKETDHA